MLNVSHMNVNIDTLVIADESTNGMFEMYDLY